MDCEFVTFGMFIIDEIHFQDERPPAKNVLGGAGAWAVIGARMFRAAPTSKTISWIVHKGSDFPASIETQINWWRTSCKFVDTPERLTTRGWNSYGDDEARAFKYTTEKLRIDQSQLNERELLAKSFHLICSPDRCMSIVNGIHERRSKLNLTQPTTAESSIFVWEPVPDLCCEAELENLTKALSLVDVVSLNHQELGAFFGMTHDLSTKQGEKQVEAQSAKLLEGAFGRRKGAVVIRCGEHGCYAASTKGRYWYPAYHEDATKVVDPTGAGNAFLGAFCIGMLNSTTREQGYHVGARYGTIAAGCAIEQIGLPRLEYGESEEYWNGVTIHDRLQTYKLKIGW